MAARVFYNENDPPVAAWLRALAARGLIPPGHVDERSIVDVRSDELREFRHAHFFAGIGGWPAALRLASWPEDIDTFTGSCPCQPFSDIGEQRGFDDERHLWPAWHRLIVERKPSVVLGEQVASRRALAWLDLVRTNLEDAGYAFGSLDCCAASIGSPHIRQRIYFVAVAHTVGARLERLAGNGDDGDEPRRIAPLETGSTSPASATSTLADDDERRREEFATTRLHDHGESGNDAARRRPTDGFWRECDWLECTDEKARPVEPGTFPLADGVPGRVVKLRAYGNAIVVPQAAHFARIVADLLA